MTIEESGRRIKPVSAEQYVAFSVRMLRPEDYEALKTYAALRGKPLAAQAREFVIERLAHDLNTVDIEALLDAKKRLLQDAAANMRPGGPKP